MPRSVTTRSSATSQGRIESIDLLNRVRDADQARAAERLRAIEPWAQRAIVEARAHAEAMALRVEADERNEDRVEVTDREAAARTAQRFGDTEHVAAQRGAGLERDEDHPAVTTTDDVRHVDTDSALPCGAETGAQVDFARHAEERGDAPAALPDAELAQGCADRPVVDPAFRVRDRATPRAQPLAQLAQGHRRNGRERRHPPVPSQTIALDKSNIWGGPRHLRLPARGGLAQCCRLTVPRGIYIKVER